MQRTLACVAACIFVLVSCQTNVETTVAPNSDPFAQSRKAYLSIIEKAMSRTYIAGENLAQKLDLPYFTSVDWSGIVFRDGAGPHDAGNLRSSYHVAMSDTFDLIRYEYAVKEFAIVMSESASFIYAEVKRQGTLSPDLEQAGKWAGELFNVADNTKFAYINAQEGVFSSSPKRELSDMASWADRIDGVIKSSGAIGFLIYKVHIDRNDIYKDPSTWFPDDVRQP